MSYRIDAHLDQGVPRLRVLEADSGSVRLVFTEPAAGGVCAGCTCACPERCPYRLALRRLFRELFLLSCGDWAMIPRLNTGKSNRVPPHRADIKPDRKRVSYE